VNDFLKGKGRTLDIAPQVDMATTKALSAQVYMARTKQHRTYLPYTFPAIAGTHLPMNDRILFLFLHLAI